MKLFKKFIYGVAALTVSATLGACQDDIDAPATSWQTPVAKAKANTSILDLKKDFWNDSTNYCHRVPAKADGTHYIVAGRVISNDYDGNVFRSLTIQDETAALQFSIYTYNLYMNYRVGQELVIDLTGMHIGKYNGLLQMGFPSWYEQGNCYETSFMPAEMFTTRCELNGLPEPSKVNIIELNSFSELSTTSPEELMKWQSQIIRVNNVEFVPQVNSTTGQTVTTFGIYKENFNQSVKDADNQSMILRTSGYSTFWNKKMPTEHGDIIALLGFFNGAYQLMFNSLTQGLQNFGSPTLPAGDKGNPWTVDEAAEQIRAGETPQGWTKGYIVGTVAPEVSVISSNTDIEWGANPVLASTVVIGATPETNDINSCIVIALPQNSPMRQYVAIANNPDNVGKQLAVYGTLAKYMGTYGITGNTGSLNEFILEGMEPAPDTPAGDGDGTENSPFSCEQIIAKAPQSTTEAVASGVWAKGYIVGFYADYTANFTASGAQATNILLSDTPTASDKSQCICVQLVAQSDARAALNLKDNPGNLGKEAQVFGDVMKYNTLPGIKNTTLYKIDGQSAPEAPADALFSETFKESQGQFTIKNILMNSPLTYVWSHDSSYGYMKASAYVSGASYASDSWLVSPEFDLSGAKDAVLNFDHVINKFPSVDVALSQVSVSISANGGDWQTINVPSWSDNTSWTFVNSGNIDLSAYAGKKILVRFRYTSTDGTSGSWEIKNFRIDGTGSISVNPNPTIPGGAGDTPVTPDTPSTELPEASGDGTQASPYNVSAVIGKGSTASETGVYVTGYIVGDMTGATYSQNAAQWEAPFDSASNILLADSPDCRDVAQCIPVQLPTAIRADLNLKDNPANLGKKVTLQGDIAKYFGTAGFKNTKSFAF